MFAKKFTLALSAPIILTTALMTACGSDDDDNNSGVSRAAVKSNYVAMAAAAYTDSVSTAETLQTAITAFVAMPNDETLEAARAAYKEARVPYQQSEIMRWDETITATHTPATGGLASIDDREGQVNAWPLDETLINEIIADAESAAISADSLATENGGLTADQQVEIALIEDPADKQAKIDEYGEANVTTGFHAIEFMLWDRVTNATGPGSRAAAEFVCVDLETTKTECRNGDYLKAAAELLVSDLKAMQAEWTNTEAGTLAHNFLESDTGIDYMAQAMASMAVGELGGARLSAGLWRDLTAVTGEIKPGDHEEEHDCFSDLSHVAVYYNFQSLMNAFYGSYTKLDGTTVSGASLGDYINSIDSSLYNKIDDVLQATSKNMQIVYDAGEATPGKSFDQIITDSQEFYENTVAERSAELIAVEAAISELAKIEAIILDVKDALSLVAVNADAIGETD